MSATMTRAVALAVAVAAGKSVLTRAPALAAAATAVLALSGATVGVRRPALRSGVRLGLAVATPIAVGVAASTALPPVRAGMAARELPADPLRWLVLRIPLATVWAEEAAFRAGLGSVTAAAFGPHAGRLIQAIAFGLSHIGDARRTREPVAATVVATAAAGWAFDWLYRRSGSLLAPMLVHLAINEAGAVAALVVQRRR
ncbi:CPBP family intramembrane metalloprotease [Mycolicibacterium cosmeticum]|uniref:Abortive infection protein n=1 Tax=Mycolicibacterium cosmeticum TaxID=258533 RepID=W9AXK2_MYCCO|nr:CPBP family intramembrane glutamic endopeptidase [Mycolicibacterium cosmeticum]TLH80152.1 CPBP family intramembrane metalloprotease [Mycolicibacterium cosmeticum]CDO07316.1 abortive infection protein [Mycolicibacterium cosmeticum]